MTEMSGATRMKSAETEFTDADFRSIAGMLHEHSGISLGEENRPLVFSRQSKHLRRLGLSRFGDYIALVRRADQAEERYRMITSLTTHTTRFFREGQHFEYLATELMPRLGEAARRGKRLRFWSAGCSTGEEAYSIAATVLQALPDAGRCDVRVLATDISREVLTVAEGGRYRNAGLSGIPEHIAPILLEPDPDADYVRIAKPVRDLVTFRYLNFVEPWPLSGPFDAIFCRNVAIYMAEDMQARVWAGLESVLGPEGVLFIGHSERLGPEFRDRLELCDKTTFRRVGSARASSDCRTD
ncbi:chemotaxis protein [Roseivivax halodurans JCM 10272]|uniref:Chemotaxis protein methyltransferase n=1 Tax=Roseivivax halodurans JCM 10272 TaxID=1449350 RepID=X7EL09_9RHOB|nr:CheR family methyltransferase [Roseivivax halodurans]ETX16607.1 chemotaxis protein [Roseivivax halodurans JCM 10272]